MDKYDVVDEALGKMSLRQKVGQLFTQAFYGSLVTADVEHMIKVNVDQFYGIEFEEFPAQIAQVALWLTDHQMNLRVSEAFGLYYARLPLRTAPTIR